MIMSEVPPKMGKSFCLSELNAKPLELSPAKPPVVVDIMSTNVGWGEC